MYQGKFYFEDGSFKLIENDTFKTLTNFKEKTFDMIFQTHPIFYQIMVLLVVVENGKCQ